MQHYSNVAGDSGVVAYEITPDGLLVKFKSGDTYAYTRAVTGRTHITQMTRLARAGRGLSTYISQHVGTRFARRIT